MPAIEPEKIHLARSMGLGGMATFFKIRLPNALPSIFGGLKIAITLAVVGAVVGEFVGGDAGLGYLLMSANGSMDTPLLFAGLVGLTLIGIVLFLLIEVAERFAIPWHTSTRKPAPPNRRIARYPACPCPCIAPRCARCCSGFPRTRATRWPSRRCAGACRGKCSPPRKDWKSAIRACARASQAWTCPDRWASRPGFDKNCDLLDALSSLGFGFLTVGSIMPEPRYGNPFPRLVRYEATESLGDSMGVPSKGRAYAVERLRRFTWRKVPVIANIGGFSAEALASGFFDVEPHADAVELSLMCPNVLAPGEVFDELRVLADVLARIEARTKPVIVRVPNDTTQSPDRMAELIERCIEARVDGLKIGGGRRIPEPGLGTGQRNAPRPRDPRGRPRECRNGRAHRPRAHSDQGQRRNPLRRRRARDAARRRLLRRPVFGLHLRGLDRGAGHPPRTPQGTRANLHAIAHCRPCLK